jgi:hypothetical protein
MSLTTAPFSLTLSNAPFIHDMKKAEMQSESFSALQYYRIDIFCEETTTKNYIAMIQ